MALPTQDASTPPQGTSPTPEEREARIAELRAKRRARMRMLAVRSGIGSLALLALAVFALYWLLTSFGGRDFLLAQVVSRLPAGTTLEWERAEGAVSDNLVMHNVRYVQKGCPDRDGEPVPYGQCDKPTMLVFTATRILVDPAIRPLLGKRLRLDALDIDGATLDLPVSDEPFELPRWPESLPQITLPLALQADTIRIDGFKVTQAGATMIDVRSLRGGLDAQDGQLRVGGLVVDSDRGHFKIEGDYAPGDNFRTNLTASALLPAPAGRTRPRIGLVARGDLATMDVAVSGHVPSPVRAHLTLRGQDDPRWSLTAQSDALDPGLMSGSGEPGTPIAFSLLAEGVGGAAELRGEMTQGDLHVLLQPSKVRIEDQVLDLDPLVVDLFGGRIRATGQGDFSTPSDARFKFAVNARNLRFGGEVDPKAPSNEPAPAIGVEADFGIAGRTAQWAAIGNATLSRDGQQAKVTFDGRGDGEAMDLKALRATMPTGTLDASGRVGWAPALQWKIDAKLAGFDPGYFARDWKGAVNGTLASTGETRDDGGLEVDVDASQLGGTLRGRRLDGKARFAMHGPATGQTRSDFDGEIALRLGDSRIDAKGSVTERLDIEANLSPLQLDDLLPEADGRLQGRVRVTGGRTTPDIDADLTGSALRYADYRAASLSAKGRLPWQRGDGTLALQARGIDVGVVLDEVNIDAVGAVERLRLDADARGEIGTLALAATAESNNGNWRGTLSSLRLAPVKGAAWQLTAPANYAQNGNRWTLSQSCFAANGGGSLCASADWPQRGLSIDANALPLALASPYLPEREPGQPWQLRGTIDLEAQLRPAGNAWQGAVTLRSSEGGLRASERARRDVIGYRALTLDADFNPSRIHATLATQFPDAGQLSAEVNTGWDAYSPLSGNLTMDISELTWLELFSQDIVEPKGRLDGRISLGGTRSQPSLGGQAHLSGFSTELPALAIALEDGDVRLDAQPDGSARITGSVRSGQGTLGIDGTLDWRGEDLPLVLNVRGDNVMASDTRDLRLIVNPDLTVRYSARQPLNVSGTVTVPSALLDLERLEGGVSVSEDVVVLDPVDPESSGTASPLALDLTLAMGDDVRLRGFGLDGRIGGNLRVRASPGREMTGSGRLEVGGKYKAYGQELTITRGNLVFTNGPVSDPVIELRAEREIEAEDITAGLTVSGRASAPQVEVWTNPATDNSQALSYLALGRSLSSLSSAQGRQLDAASAALTAGGSLLASQLGTKIGLDDAGVMQSRALGGSVLGIGKQLSPKLYVGFGVSLLGTGQVLTLKYLLRKGFDVEIESSTLESRGSVNWRHESN